ncbi:sigma 54-interacting transcriptional regulator [Candidatus Nitrospira bockiana]
MTKAELNYEVLLEVTNVLNLQRDSEGLWKAITRQIQRVVPWDRAGILLYDPVHDGFRFYAVVTNVERPALSRETIIPRVGSAMGWVYDRKQLHVRPNLHQEQVFLEDKFYLEEGLGRMINFPLLVQDECLGTLNIGSRETGEPDPEDLKFLQQVATQIAYAIAHVRAYEHIKRLSEQLSRENEYLAEEVRVSRNMGALVGRSQGFQHVLDLIRAVAPTPTSVLLLGETGTGKELLARAVHDLSPRRHKPFIRVNCAALPSGLVESELFGHERGAFTGASSQRPGRFELAHGGTLFLDEIGEMPLEAQAKLLRVLQDGMVDRIGGTTSVSVDVRIVAATNADLGEAIKKGTFRSDLFYRLHVFPVVIPPLRERREDIPLLADHFLSQAAARLKRRELQLSRPSLDRLMRYSWPGNVRELQNLIERAVILTTGETVEIDDGLFPKTQPTADLSPGIGRTTLQQIEYEHILSVLERTGWRIYGPDGAAAQLGLNPETLRSKLRKLGLKKPSRATPG